MIQGERVSRQLNRRDILLLAMGATGGLILAACSGSDDQPQETETEAGSPTVAVPEAATPIPSPTRGPTATPIPDLGLTNSIDGASLDVVRYDDLNVFGHYDAVRIAEDGTRHLIPLQAIEWGGVARDGIPAINAPSYVGPERWYEMVYDPDGLVIGVEVNGKHRAYPLQILIWHEIVNETFDGKHLLVTY